MLSEIRKQYRRGKVILQSVLQLRISTKITVLYAAILMVVLILSSVVTGLGVFFSFYHQAEVEIAMSMQHMLEDFESGRMQNPAFWRKSPVMPGVVLRITDITGQLIYQNDDHYPSIELIEANEIGDPPFWADQKMRVSELRNFSIYHAKVAVDYQGQIYQLHFFRTITAERNFLSTLQRFLFITTLVGCILALGVGYFVSRRILSPIRDMTDSAREIEVSQLGRRLEVPPTRDELAVLAETFNHMLERLERGFEQQKRFVSDASHELRTPVTVILGYSDLLSRWGREDAKVLDEGIASIRSEAENMQELIEKLLFLARADQKRQVLHKEILDMGQLLTEVMGKMKLVTKTHSVELLASEEAYVYGDKVTLRQLLRIFLENSIKYTPAGGHITASCRKMPEGEKLEVVLADDGIGIAKEEQQKIFERFYRVDSSRTKGTGAGGTGLGLSIAKWIAEQHGIAISMDSAPGRGTRIHLLIPLADRSKEKTETIEA